MSKTKTTSKTAKKTAPAPVLPLPLKFVTVVVLNDGETFTDISGCSICIVPADQYEKAIRSGGDARDFRPIVEIALNDQTFPQDDEAWDHGGALGQFQREENA